MDIDPSIAAALTVGVLQHASLLLYSLFKGDRTAVSADPGLLLAVTVIDSPACLALDVELVPQSLDACMLSDLRGLVADS